MGDLYIAKDKETGEVISGAKGQYAFNNTGTLRRSIGQSIRWTAHQQDKKPSDFYDVYRLDLTLIDEVGLLEEVD